MNSTVFPLWMNCFTLRDSCQFRLWGRERPPSVVPADQWKSWRCIGSFQGTVYWTVKPQDFLSTSWVTRKLWMHNKRVEEIMTKKLGTRFPTRNHIFWYGRRHWSNLPPTRFKCLHFVYHKLQQLINLSQWTKTVNAPPSSLIIPPRYAMLTVDLWMVDE